MLLQKSHTLTRAAAGSLFAITAALGLAACSDSTGGEAGTTIEDVQAETGDYGYDGVYDNTFYESVDGYEGETVTLSADVNQILSDSAFTIAGGDVEELLVVGASGTNELEKGSVIKVTGVVYTAFDLPAVEQRLDADLDDEIYDLYDAEPYIQVTSIETDPVTEDGE